ncbi:MAG: SPOR domain-containing protein [Sphingomonas sp.]|nr:SPOR domain-containing protein [Sphingomonas sp.]
MIHRHFFLAAILAATASPLAAQNVRAGIEAWQRADYARAVAIWRPLAEAGDADAQFNLGQAYRLGRGLAINLAVAKTWFERAADKGHVDAQTTLGLLLFQNGEQVEGLKWLGKAAGQGEARAMLIYGTALVNGDTVTQDPVLGYAYVSRASAQGLAPAKDTLRQLDEIIPIADRKKGLALAKAKAKAAPPPGSRAARTAARKNKPKSAQAPDPKPVAVAAAPPQPVAPLKPTPTKPTPAKPAASPATGNWRIQLGAFGQRGAAQSLFSRLSGSLGGRQAYYMPAGAVTRLQVGPFASKSEAAAACARLKGQSCFPVATK